MKLYKYHGVIPDFIEEPELVLSGEDVTRDKAAAFIKEEQPHCYYLRTIRCEDGSIHFDYGSWSSFYVLTDEDLENEDT